MSIVSLTTPPGAAPPAGVSVGAGAPTSDQRVEAPNVGADDLANLARMDSDAGCTGLHRAGEQPGRLAMFGK